jgi:hypothetical protein
MGSRIAVSACDVSARTAWPVTLANGCVGIQTYPTGAPTFWNFWEADIHWNLYHEGPPGVDMDWSCADVRC